MGSDNGLAGCQDGESLEDQGQGNLVKRVVDRPVGMGTKCEDLCVLMPPGKRHQITRYNDSATAPSQPVIGPSRAGTTVHEQSSCDGRVETMAGLKTKVSQLLLLLNAHPASNRDQSPVLIGHSLLEEIKHLTWWQADYTGPLHPEKGAAIRVCWDWHTGCDDGRTVSFPPRRLPAIQEPTQCLAQ